MYSKNLLIFLIPLLCGVVRTHPGHHQSRLVEDGKPILRSGPIPHDSAELKESTFDILNGPETRRRSTPKTRSRNTPDAGSTPDDPSWSGDPAIHVPRSWIADRVGPEQGIAVGTQQRLREFQNFISTLVAHELNGDQVDGLVRPVGRVIEDSQHVKLLDIDVDQYGGAVITYKGSLVTVPKHRPSLRSAKNDAVEERFHKLLEEYLKTTTESPRHVTGLDEDPEWLDGFEKYIFEAVKNMDGRTDIYEIIQRPKELIEKTYNVNITKIDVNNVEASIKYHDIGAPPDPVWVRTLERTAKHYHDVEWREYIGMEPHLEQTKKDIELNYNVRIDKLRVTKAGQVKVQYVEMPTTKRPPFSK